MDTSDMQQRTTAYASASTSATDWMEQLNQQAQLQGGGQAAAAAPPGGHVDGYQPTMKALSVTDSGVYNVQKVPLCDGMQLALTSADIVPLQCQRWMTRCLDRSV